MERGHDIAGAWTRAVKQVIARFARGNINAKQGRILLPEEQEAERCETLPIARSWRDRYVAWQDERTAKNRDLDVDFLASAWRHTPPRLNQSQHKPRGKR
jgi:hypothetical protein